MGRLTPRTQKLMDTGNAAVEALRGYSFETMWVREARTIDLFIRPPDRSCSEVDALVVKDHLMGAGITVSGIRQADMERRPWPDVWMRKMYDGVPGLVEPDALVHTGTCVTPIAISRTGKTMYRGKESVVLALDDSALAAMVSRTAYVLEVGPKAQEMPPPTSGTKEAKAMKHILSVLFEHTEDGEFVLTERYIRSRMADPCHLGSTGTFRSMYVSGVYYGILWTARMAKSKEVRTPDGKWVRAGTKVWTLGPHAERLAAEWGWR